MSTIFHSLPLFTLVCVSLFSCSDATESVGVSVEGSQLQIVPESELNKQHVAISFTQDPSYLFYAPITAAAFKEVGFEPILLMVETPNANDQLVKLVTRYAKKWSRTKINTVTPKQEMAVLTSQVARIFAACLPSLRPNASVMTTDVDMLVLDKRIGRQWNKTNPAHYTGYFASYKTVGQGQQPIVNDQDPWNDEKLEGKWTMLQMCFLEARVWVWREALGLPADGCDLSQAIRNRIAKDKPDVDRLGWTYDQHLLTTSFTAERAVLKKSGLDIDLHSSELRSEPYMNMDGRFRPWDEATYPANTDFKAYSFAHLPRAGYEKSKWDVTLRLLTQRFGRSFGSQADKYYKEFMDILQGNTA